MTHRPFAPEGTAARIANDTAGCPPAARPFVLAATIVGSSMAFIDGTRRQHRASGDAAEPRRRASPSCNGW